MKINSYNEAATKFFTPRYNEIALFLMSLAFILLFLTDIELRAESYHTLLEKKFDPRNYITLSIFVMGMLLSLYHVFTTRQKSDFEKTAMLFFAILVNGFSGIAAGIHILKNSHNILMLFPIWNIFNGVLLLAMYRYDFIDESSIVDDNSMSLQVILGSIVIVTILLVSRHFYEMYWAITFSICVSYATNINGTIQSIIIKARRSRISEA